MAIYGIFNLVSKIHYHHKLDNQIYSWEIKLFMKISIITIVFNRKNFISDCINSVLTQSYPDIEYIVIDGGSTDGTCEIIEKYRERLAVYISEKDNGPYDALNKGLKNATGDIIGILHSDDIFFDQDSLLKVAQAFKTSSVHIVYAKGIFVDEKNPNIVKRKYPSKPFQRRYLQYGWIPLHTTIFVRKMVYDMYGGYDPGFSIASDYDISLRWFQNEDISKLYLDEWLVKMRMGGLSTSIKLQLKKSREDLRIINQYQLGGVFTLVCKIGRKIPQYLIPQVMGFK